MTTLKFYREEKILYKEAYEKKIPEKELPKIFNKLKRHYKLDVSLELNSRWKGHFKIYPTEVCSIDLPCKTSFGLLCHEIAHAIQWKKYGRTKSYHNKKFMRLIGRVVNYCKKHNWWGESTSCLESQTLHLVETSTLIQS